MNGFWCVLFGTWEVIYIYIYSLQCNLKLKDLKQVKTAGVLK